MLEACASLIGEAYTRGAHLEEWEEEMDGPMVHVPRGTAQQRWVLVYVCLGVRESNLDSPGCF